MRATIDKTLTIDLDGGCLCGQTRRMISELPDAPGTIDPEPFAGPDHPMRKVTRRVAFEGAWDLERAKKVGKLFDSMASEWGKRADEPRAASIIDAIDRGAVPRNGRWIELGSGTGAGTSILRDAGIDVIALDLAMAMLANADPELAPRVQADSSQLPIGDRSVDAVLCVNMLLFPNEIDRILNHAGVLVWVNSLGDQTPIHLPPIDVLRALPGDWVGHTARAGSGFWVVASRAQ